MEGSNCWNPGEAYKLFRSISKESSLPAKIMYNGKHVNGLQNISGAFNDHFASLLVRDESVLKVPKILDNLICLDDISFSKNDVLENFSEIKSGSNLIDEMSPVFLQSAAPFLISHILFIFGCSINKCQFTDIWKTVHVRPRFKSGSRLDIKKYRPIAKLTSLSLVFERLVYKHFKQLIQKKLMETISMERTAWFSHWSINDNSTPYLLRQIVLFVLSARGRKETNICFP